MTIRSGQLPRDAGLSGDASGFLRAFPPSEGCPTALHALARASGADRGITLLPDQEAGPIERRDYRSLAEKVWRLAAALRRAGIEAGEPVLLVLPTGWGFIEGFLACQVLGALPVPAYPPPHLQHVETALDRLHHIIRDAGVRTVLTDRSLSTVLMALGAGRRAAKRVLTLESLPQGDTAALEPSVGDLAFLQYTSGSTSNPRGVVVSHQALMANLLAAGQASNITTQDCIVSWLPLYHDMGLVGGLMTPIFWQANLVLMSPMAFLAKPERWLKAISDYRGTITMGPNFAYARCVQRVRNKQGLDLSSLRIALNGAEPINATTVDAFNRAFADCGLSDRTMYPAYGLAESVVAVTFSTPGEPLFVEQVDRAMLSAGKAVLAEEGIALVGCGRAIPGHTVEIVDDSGTALPARSIGQIVVSGPSLMRGYHRNTDASRAVLQGGRLYTGDLGYLSEGRLFVTGRAKDLIIVRGKNFFAEDIESIAESVAGVRRGSSLAIGIYDNQSASERVVLIVEGGPSTAVDQQTLAAAIQGHVAEVAGLRVEEVHFAPRGSIPKTPSGKRQRQKAKERYLRGTLRPSRPRLVRIAARALTGLTVLAMRRLAGIGSRVAHRASAS